MMSDFDYSLDVGDAYDDGYDDDDGGWDGPPMGPMGPPPGPIFNSRRSNSGFMNAQYGEAFGDYRGGYGPGGGFGPPPRQRPYPLFPPPGPPGPPRPQRGRGYGPIGPPLQRRGPSVHRAVNFLERCGVARQMVKMLPRQLLDMIEPEYCGLCAQNFESFAVAKIHYNCKNHNKAQKKFMALHKPTKNQNEIPMKARNLYCELCDVHITSTSHADSHYAGKSHRSIVEGRKPPKNPILLQHGMGARVEQLIRREKKNLKAVVEVEKVEEETPVERNIPPELICEICKTSVTCSEQMTNHLNGKRHLSKEKQHILNMMKGKAPEKNIDISIDEPDEEMKEADAAEADNDAAEGEGETPTAEEHFNDWAAGGGTDWDAQNQPLELQCMRSLVP